jgi:serine/threonine protein kinase
MKLCDFGSSILVKDNALLANYGRSGTEGFRAPEVSPFEGGTVTRSGQSAGYDGYAADMFSVGKTMELWTCNREAQVRR